EYIVNPVIAAGGQVESVAINIRDITERKHMEEALREGEERFRLASDAAHALVYDVDLCSGQAHSVHGLPVLIGYDPGEKPQTMQWWFSQVHPEDRSAVEQKLREYFESAKDYSMEYRVLHRDGRCIIVQDTGQIIRDTGGVAVRVVGGVVDITRRKQLEDALRESEERLRLAINAANEAIWDWDLINGTLRWNETYANWFGLPQSREPGQWWAERLHPDDRDRAVSSLRAALDGDSEAWSAEYRLRSVDGSWAYMYDRAIIARDEAGRPTRIIGAMLNLTERKQAEAALRESEERYRQLADKLERMVGERTVDLQRLNRTLAMITDCNEAIVRAHREEELLADICRTIIDVGGYRMAWVGFAQDDPAKTVLPVAFSGSEMGYLSRVQISWADSEHGRGPTGTSIRTGKPCIGRDFRSDPALSPWRKEALRCGFRSSIALPLAGSDRTIGALTIYSAEPKFFGKEQVEILQELADDIAFGIVALRTRAERDRALRALEHRTAQLRKLASELTHTEERERRQLAQAIHDNLQQLLVGAKLSNDSLRRRCETKAQLDVVEQLGEFLKESLDAARSLTFELSPPVLYDVGLAAALEWLGRWVQSKYGLTVAVKAAKNAEPQNEDVRVLLFQATRELLFNVVKHAQVKTAEVRMSRVEGHRVRIEVKDKGVGFDPAKLGGDGLKGGFGLFSIRERLDLLGGQIDIESSPEDGSRFSLLAPLGSAVAARPAEAGPRPVAGARRPRTSPLRGSAADRQRIRVLLADDHTLMRQGLVRLLQEQHDIEVVGEANDSQEALELARQVVPDVVLMDVHMPRMNGIEATAQLTKELPQVMVVALSMWDDSDWVTAMSNAGAVAYLNKTGPLENLLKTIRRCFPSAEEDSASVTANQSEG
ncbi:MAG TPA: PAS domain-containing protein, partial [Acidobacteriota bacterium]|nr:PAS domain-containing protein [Acidobacteriota bacterium]